jgi:hypothetical protein
MLAVASFAGAAPAPKLQTFGTGVTIDGSDSATIDIVAGEYGGVYLNSKSQSGKTLSNVDFGFTAAGDVAGGAPRFSLPIDDPATSAKGDGYAFIDVNSCGGDTDVSTWNDDCVVYFGNQVHDNWNAFAAAQPTYKVTSGVIPFIIADAVPSDGTGHYEISDIVLR